MPGNSCPGILLPDTIIFRHQRLHAWFFTSGTTADTILMKKKRSMTHSEILKKFMRKNRSGVHACYLQSASTQPQVDGPRNCKSSDLTIDVEYHDAAQLRDFLRRSRVGQHSILQRFVDGKGEYHTMIRATWSPQVCLLERRSSAERMCDRRRDIYRRCSTFDASLHDTPTSPMVGESLTTLVKAACNNIVNHIEKVTRGAKRITRMVAYFTQDERASKLWFRWCTCLRVEHYKNDFEPAKPISLASTSIVAKYTDRKSVSDAHQRRLEALQQELARSMRTDSGGQAGKSQILADKIESVLMATKHAPRAERSVSHLDSRGIVTTIAGERKYQWDQTGDDLSKRLAPDLIFHCPICGNHCRIESGVPVQHSIVLRAGSEFLEPRIRDGITAGRDTGTPSGSTGDIDSRSLSREMSSASDMGTLSSSSVDSLGQQQGPHPLRALAASLQSDAAIAKHCRVDVPLDCPDLARETLLCETCCLLCNDEVMNGLVATRMTRKKQIQRDRLSRSDRLDGGLAESRSIIFGRGASSVALRRIPIMPVRCGAADFHELWGSRDGSRSAGGNCRPRSVPKCAFQQTESLQRRFQGDAASRVSNGGGNGRLCVPGAIGPERSAASDSCALYADNHRASTLENFRQIYGKRRSQGPTSKSAQSTPSSSRSQRASSSSLSSSRLMQPTIAAKPKRQSFQVKQPARSLKQGRGSTRGPGGTKLAGGGSAGRAPSIAEESKLTSEEAAFLSEIVESDELSCV